MTMKMTLKITIASKKCLLLILIILSGKIGEFGTNFSNSLNKGLGNYLIKIQRFCLRSS